MSEKKGSMVQFDYDPALPGSMDAETEARLDAIKDEDIDYSDIPELTDECLERAAKRDDPNWVNMRPVDLWVDKQVLAYFQACGGDYRHLMSEVLRAYAEEQQGGIGARDGVPLAQ